MGGPSSSETNQQKQSWANLNSLFGTASNVANQFGAQGSNTLDQVTNYFKSLFSRQGATQAEAPAINAAKDAETAAKKQEASLGTSRTGGTAAGNQQREDTTRAQIDSLISGAAPAAATALTSIGESDVNAMLNALGIGTSAAGTVGAQTTGDINAQRQASAAMWASLIGGAAKLGSAFIPGFSFGASAPSVPNNAGAADIYGPAGNIGFG